MESKHVSFSYGKALIEIQPKTLTSTLQAPYQHHTFLSVICRPPPQVFEKEKEEEKKKILQIKVPKKIKKSLTKNMQDRNKEPNIEGEQ
jgi:hypothetical protein